MNDLDFGNVEDDGQWQKALRRWTVMTVLLVLTVTVAGLDLFLHLWR